MARTSRKSTPPPPPVTWDEKLINMLLPWRAELAGIVLAFAGLLILLNLLGLTRSAPLAWVSGGLRLLAGWGAVPLVLSLIAVGAHVASRQFRRPYTIEARQVVGFELVLITLLALTHELSGATLTDAFAGRRAGVVGWALSEPLRDFLGPILAYLLYAALLILGVAFLARVPWSAAPAALRRLSAWLLRRAERWEAQAARLRAARRAALAPEPPPVTVPIPVPAPVPRRPRPASLPPLTILQEDRPGKVSPVEIEHKKQIIEKTLADFGLPATVTGVRHGPTITQFGVAPGYIERAGPDGKTQRQKVRVGQIAALDRDLALALKVPRLRIEAPVPGQRIVGVEVPNMEIGLVRLRPVLEADAFRRVGSPLAIALGRDVAGQPVATDLARLPHLLIAGTTGSGKSVALNGLITTLACNNTPEQLRLVLIDPKKVELIRFNGLPHLLGPSETDHERVIGVLRWLTAEMDRRYQALAELGARNLAVYNERVTRRAEGRPLPTIVVVIDELADLMAIYPSDVERTLCRLAQMARAIGIHLVVATQRPSTDVLTGLIKANFPARIAFAVASGTDSWVILDAIGAENLLGRGDMLFLSPDAGAPRRIQGCLVDDEEITRLVNYWREALPDWPGEPPPWEETLARLQVIEETDDMLEKAVAFAKAHENISTSLLQRKLRIGYPRAARLMEALHEMGMVEDPRQAGRTRRTLVDDGDEDPLGSYLKEQDAP